MTNKKKHLKYRATKTQSTPKAAVVSTSVAKTTLRQSAQAPLAPVPADFTRLTADQQRLVKLEVWHIGVIAIGILGVYGVLWLGFHYAGWSEVILRYIPHGQ